MGWSQFLTTLLDWMQNMGYLGLFLLMILENVFPPLPSEMILPAAGYAASQGKMNFLLVVLIGAAGSVIGTLPLYYLGRALGLERVAALADKYGKWLTVSSRDIHKADEWFDRYGQKIVLFGRMIPGVRSLLSVPAGISGMQLPKFLLYSFLGSALWAGLLAALGYWLGEHADVVTHYIDPLSKLIGLGLLVAFVAWVLKRRASLAPDEERTADEDVQSAPSDKKPS